MLKIRLPEPPSGDWTLPGLPPWMGPLLRARENIARFGLGGQIECRLSDGLAALRPGEAQSIGETAVFTVERQGSDLLRLTTDAGQILLRLRSGGAE